MAQIAREIGCARDTVVKFLLDFGIELRKDGLQPTYPKSQLAYGERFYGGKVIPHLGEQQVIDKFIELRQAGLSFAGICNWANRNGIPTKNRAAKWDRRTIFEIVRRRGGGKT